MYELAHASDSDLECLYLLPQGFLQGDTCRSQMYVPFPNITVEYTGRCGLVLQYSIMCMSHYFTNSVCTGVYTAQHSPPLYLLPLVATPLEYQSCTARSEEIPWMLTAAANYPSITKPLKCRQLTPLH